MGNSEERRFTLALDHDLIISSPPFLTLSRTPAGVARLDPQFEADNAVDLWFQ